MNQPRVSVIINSFNYGCFIQEAIESVLAQDFPAEKMEIIVVDDGSTDDTAQRVGQFGTRVRYEFQNNAGQAAAINRGFNLARGEIVALLDADDTWRSQKVSRTVAMFDLHPDAGMIQHKRLLWDIRSGAIEEENDLPNVSGNVASDPLALLRYGTTSTSAMAFRKKHMQRLLPIPDRLQLLVDGYLGGLIIFVAPVYVLNEALTLYRMHDSNSFHFEKAGAETQERRLKSIDALAKEMKSFLTRSGFNLDRRDLQAFLRRYQIIEESYRFASRGAGRFELLKHLRLQNQVYGPLWSRRYRLYRQFSSFAAFALGYNAYRVFQNVYRRRNWTWRIRESILPAAGKKSPATMGLPLSQDSLR